MNERGIREVCKEAITLLQYETPNDMVYVGEISGYFYEILSILDETEDDGK